jgi:DNA-binding transcriptional ArsR family regulator
VKPITDIDDPRYVKALAHPLRIRILAMLEERPSSPVRVAKQLGLPIGRVAYHVRTLEKLGLLQLVETHQRRGATEHVYKALAHPQFNDDAWAALGPVGKQRMLSAMLRQIGEYANGSAAAGGFDRADAHITRTALKLDEQGWTRLAEATKKWLREVERIEDAASARLAGEGDDARPVDVGLVIMLFEALPFSQRPVPPKPDASPAGAKRSNGRRRADLSA